MTHVLDPSAIALVLRRLGEKTVEFLEGEVTLDLAFYELGNVMWKECVVEKMGVEEAVSRAGELLSLLQTMVLERASTEFAENVMRIAVEQGVTFYDSSYLSMARARNAVLVTEDAEILEGGAG